jgi:hypothetical protein
VKVSNLTKQKSIYSKKNGTTEGRNKEKRQKE